jgi:hypothetical protein
LLKATTQLIRDFLATCGFLTKKTREREKNPINKDGNSSTKSSKHVCRWRAILACTQEVKKNQNEDGDHKLLEDQYLFGRKPESVGNKL